MTKDIAVREEQRAHDLSTKEELEQCLPDLGKLDLDLVLKRSIWSLMSEKKVKKYQD